MKTIEIKVHSIAEDGLPDMERLTGRVAFIFDGSVVSGWPVDGGDQWEIDAGGLAALFSGVTHWVEFPDSISRLER